ncbi:MAG: tetratricopeptide repeat protein [Planctomycetaceae bacterium]
MDPYAPCPCGSGKKVKFCCQKLLPEMEKIERLQENQPEQALIHLDRLERTSPGNPWIAITRAGTLMTQGEFGAAKVAILKFLKDNPEHPRANALYAFASFHADGYPASKKAVHRAFKRCVTESPRIVSALLEALGEHHFMSGHVLAARAHLMLALRIASIDEDRDRVIQSVVRFDGDSAVPFLLRGGQMIPQYEAPAEQAEAFDKARHLSLLACWEEAADLLDQVAEQDPQSAALQHMVGLFRAWDGDEEAAAESLHKAAGLYGSGPIAIECETIAQFLDRQHSDNVVEMRMQRYEVTSLSQLLSRLDQNRRFVRSDEDRDLPDSPGAPVATYLILDRPLPNDDELAALTPDTVPLYIGRVLAFDAVPDDDMKAMAFLTGLTGDQLSSAESAFLGVAEEFAQRMESPTPAQPAAEAASPSEADAGLDVIGEIPIDELPLHRNYFVPPGTPGPVRSRILDSHWKNIAEELWLTAPQDALGGKSPRDAAPQPERRVALEAALNVLQAFADERNRLIPIEQLRNQLGLPAVEPTVLEGEGASASLSSFDLERLNITSLTDEQLDELTDRLRVSSHSRLMYVALREWLRRNGANDAGDEQDAVRRNGTLTLLANIAGQFSLPDEALEYVRRGQQLVKPMEDHRFEKQLIWKMQELRLRAVFGSAEDLRPLLLDLWENYGTKLPNLRRQLEELVAQLKMEAPWSSNIVTAGNDWSPTQVAAGSGSTQKLWLPGQD